MPMPPIAQTPSREHDRDQTSAWIILASMFVGHRLDKQAALGAYVAATAILAVSVIILLATRHLSSCTGHAGRARRGHMSAECRAKQ
jgi:hypothetical protein